MASVKHVFRPLRPHFMQAWRLFRGISQDDAAGRIGISRTQLSKIENINSPYLQWHLEAAAVVYGCTMADLLMRDPRIKDETPPVSPVYDALKKAPEPKRKQIEAVIETLLKTET